MKSRLLIITLICLFFLNRAPLTAQDIDWVKSFKSNDDEFVHDLCVDQQGNVFTTGRSGDSTDFDPGPGIFKLAQMQSAFVSKLDSAGNFKWVVGFDGWGDTDGKGIITDNSGNVYVTGTYAQQLQVSNSAATLNGNGMFDVFVAKLNVNGNLLWLKNFGGKNWDEATEIALDVFGNVYVLGYIDMDTVDMDPGPATHTLGFAHNEPMLVKLDNNGNFMNCFKFGSYDIKVDAQGFIYTNSGLGISKFDSMGNILWTQAPKANAIALDASGNVYATGSFNSYTDFDAGAGTQTIATAGNADVYIQKISSNGSRLWLQNFGGSDADWVYGLDASEAGYICISGAFQLSADFDPGQATYSLTCQGSVNGFLLLLNEDGDFYGARRFGGNHQDFATAVAVGADGAIHVSGYFSSTAYFGTGTAGTYTLQSLPQGFHDAFVLKINKLSVGMDELTTDYGIHLYPNPASGYVMLRTIETCDVILTSINGKTILEFKTTGGEVQLPLKDLAQGLYLLNISNKKSFRNFKLLVE
ncbi:MAG: T9SS type A sorting domain-containing protein [Bacteroidia bacterium]|nr:T9SS type A sorting domain-containing protein [Bacteroidia bacterium]